MSTCPRLSSFYVIVARHLPPESAYFLAVNRNKRSMTVNLKKSEGIEIVRKLVKRSDVLVENFIPGKLASIGLGWEDCQQVNPRLIYASVTGTFSLDLVCIYFMIGRLRSDWPVSTCRRI